MFKYRLIVLFFLVLIILNQALSTANIFTSRISSDISTFTFGLFNFWLAHSMNKLGKKEEAKFHLVIGIAIFVIGLIMLIQ